MVERKAYRFKSDDEREKFYNSLAEKASDKNGVIFISQYMTEKGFSEIREGRVYYVSGYVVLNNRNPFLSPVEIIGNRRNNKSVISKLEKLTGIKLKLVK